MSGSNVWSRSRERLRRFPELLAQCSDEAAVYGKCVAASTKGREELKKDLCAREFEALKTCFANADLKQMSQGQCCPFLQLRLHPVALNYSDRASNTHLSLQNLELCPLY
uniref:NADH:ubiquinone oxidoreductase complex assembly factor 8 n=1 Tax=Stegastes partitus TaxID=144197 RepID=A0A3B5BEV1_9TELE